MKISFEFKDGSTGKDIAAHLRFQAGLFEGLEPKVASSRTNTDAPVATETEDVEEPAAPKAKRGRPAKAVAAQTSFDEEETTTEESESFEDEESFEEAPAPKKAKAKKYTVEDLNDVCKAYARENGGGKDGRDAVLAILKKHFKTTSISQIATEDYEKAIKLLAV